MAQVSAAGDGERQRESVFKFDYPQQKSETSMLVSDGARPPSVERGKALRALNPIDTNGPGGVYAHANFASSQLPSSSLPPRSRMTTPGTSPMREESNHRQLSRSGSAMSTSSSSSTRNQLVNPSYSPYVTGASPADRPQEAFGTSSAVQTVDLGQGKTAGTTPISRIPRSVSPDTRPRGLPPHPATPTTTASSAPAIPRSTGALPSQQRDTGAAPGPTTTASLLERLEKYRQSGANGHTGSSMASSLEQNALQRVGSLGNIAPARTVSSSASAGVSPTIPRARFPSQTYTVSGVSPSLLHHGLSSRPTPGISSSQSVAGGTRTAELDARLQRAIQVSSTAQMTEIRSKLIRNQLHICMASRTCVGRRPQEPQHTPRKQLAIATC